MTAPDTLLPMIILSTMLTGTLKFDDRLKKTLQRQGFQKLRLNYQPSVLWICFQIISGIQRRARQPPLVPLPGNTQNSFF